MPESDAAVDRGDNGEKEDCPVCLEPMAPFWDRSRRAVLVCCGQFICVDCMDKRDAVVRRARASGSYGRQEEQLASTCPLCRTETPKRGTGGRVMVDKFEKGQLPLKMYCDVGMHFVKGIQGDRGVERGVERGTEMLMLGAERGDPNCQFVIGYGYQEGSYGFTQSISKAKRWYLAATEQGHAIAEFKLALLFGEDGNDAEYVRHMSGSASKGYNDACFNLGLAHWIGSYRLQESTEEAIRVLTPGAERGDANSMGFLGLLLTRPEPFVPPPDNPKFTRGVHWLRLAADAGDQKAISDLREMEGYASARCFLCGVEAPSEKAFLRCSRCRAAWYCSKNCQVKHWKATEGGHKQYCITACDYFSRVCPALCVRTETL